MAAATQVDIRRWLEERSPDCTHMIVACDTFDWDDYPVYCTSDEECLAELDHLKEIQMTRVMAVYDCRADIEEQLAGEGMFRRAMNVPRRPTDE